MRALFALPAILRMRFLNCVAIHANSRLGSRPREKWHAIFVAVQQPLGRFDHWLRVNPWEIYRREAKVSKPTATSITTPKVDASEKSALRSQ